MSIGRWHALAVSVFLGGACAGGTTIEAVDGAGGQEIFDVPAAEVGQGDGITVPDWPGADAFEAGDLGDEVAQADSGCAPGGGCFLDPCQEASDCLTGLCVDHMGELVCSMTCVEECPDGWSCKLVDGVGPDPMHVCISNVTTLCLPCAANSDCETAGGKVSCLNYGAKGSFCGAECAGNVCPTGFSCVPAVTVDGATVKQCVADAGDCPCSEKAVALGLSTPCVRTSQFGECEGVRMCGPEGMSDCSASEPAQDLCNGLDDDCDGDTDENSCDDENPCTKDTCDAALGCQNVPMQGGCDDQDVCTLADHCEDGVCVGEPIDCDDGNPCTYDNCDALGGCEYTYNTASCDDSDPCTVADSCKKGVCAGVDVSCDCQVTADCGPLEDGDVCNGTLVCDTESVPHKCILDPASIVACPKPAGIGAECLVAVCDPKSGDCGVAPANEGGACNDGNACTVQENCVNAVCGGGTAKNCTDDNPCTADWCDPAIGCQHDDNQEPCSDGNSCTVGDQCAGAQCVPGDVLVCDDGNPCTSDGCDPMTGCTHGFVVGACDDGNSCTTGDACVNGQCKGVGSLECDDGNACTKDICLAQGGCDHMPLDAGCSDGDPCTVSDKCAGGVCKAGTPVNCDDSNPCTKDACVAGSCEHKPQAGACDDLNACSTGDQCVKGECLPDSVADCDDDNPCTTDWCDPLAGCIHTHNQVPCDDGDGCTQGEKCSQGICSGGKLVACDDKNPCTDDSCLPATGCMVTPNTASCNDGNPCTTGDACQDGACVGGPALGCDDKNPCTDDSCDPAVGCMHAANAAQCDDGNACTAVDACQGGTCKGFSAPNCDDGNMCTVDSCAPQTGCVHDSKPMQGKPCVIEDGGLCGSMGSCNLGACFAVGKLCDDKNPCTDDSCNPMTGVCSHAANSDPCDDSNPCTENDTCTAGACLGLDLVSCDDSNPCTSDKCSPLLGCQHSNNVLPCDDGDLCTLTDVCTGGACVGSGVLKCNDGNPCTSDTCDPVQGCVHAPGEGPCDDGDICTTGDACQGGQCKGAGTLSCNDGNPCTADSCDPKGGCIHTPTIPCCGNGVQEAGEECDDGNLKAGDGCSATCTIEPLASCKALHSKYPALGTGNYTIDPDGAAGPVAPLSVRCDMSTDGGGYTMVRFNDGGLSGGQDNYRAYCSARGMEVICPRTKAHAMSIQAWNNGEPPNLVNVFPKYNGAYGLSNWTGRCQGQSCSYWMSDSDSCGCTNFEPNGDNDTGNALYRRTTGCDFGNWNDAGGNMDIHGSVICSTNDK
jgi:cysteine-rich repeat protein